jgi:hypothetical protein
MANNKELEAGLKAMARDFHFPGGGRKKLSRLVTEHLVWFDSAERRGMTWRDMITALAAAGVTGRSGRPLSIGTLSATVWRARSEEAAGETVRRRGEPESSQRAGVRQKEQPTGIVAERLQGEKRTVVPHGTDHGRPRQAAPALSKRSNSDSGALSNKDVLAFMDSARSVRRRSE